MPRLQPPGFLSIPASGAAPGVLVLHPWWGLNDTIKDFCRRLSGEGFIAFAPDLYHGKIGTTIPEAEALSDALDGPTARSEVADAAAFLSDRAGGHGRDLAVVGFSLGAYFALNLSATRPEHVHSVVLFYGTGPADFKNARAAYLGHFAGSDPYESEADVATLEDAIRGAGRTVTFHRYPGTGHWFFEPDRSDAYNEAAAAVAWDRTLAFLRP